MLHQRFVTAITISIALLRAIDSFTEEVDFVYDTDCYDDQASKADEEVPFINIEEILPNLEISCRINARAVDEDIEFLLINMVPETQVQKCFVACWMERLQIVRIYLLYYINKSSMIIDSCVHMSIALSQVRKEKFQPERYIEVSTYQDRDKAHKIMQLSELLTECKYVDIGNPQR